MLSVLAVALLAQAPSATVTHDAAVITTSRSDEASRAHVERALESARRALRQAGLEVQSEAETRRRLGGQGPENCRQNLACYALLGRSINVSLVVKVDVSVIETDLAISAQAISASESSVVAELSTLTATTASESDMAALFAPFAAQVKERAPRREATSALKTPIEDPNATTGPTPPGPSPIVTQPGPTQPQRSRATAFIPLGVGAASLVAGGVLFNDARWVHEQFVPPDPSNAPPLSPQLQEELQARGERSQTLGMVFTGLGLAGVAAGAVMFFTAGESGDANVAVTVTPTGAFAAGVF